MAFHHNSFWEAFWKIIRERNGEMSKWLKHLFFLQRTQVQFLGSTWMLTAIWSYSFRGSNILFWLLQLAVIYMWTHAHSGKALITMKWKWTFFKEERNIQTFLQKYSISFVTICWSSKSQDSVNPERGNRSPLMEGMIHYKDTGELG